MKKLFVLMIILGLTSCSFNKSELFKITDSFVESLSTSYQSYGIFDGKEHAKTTSDGLYQVMPIGRLINVKILKAVNDDIYKDLEKNFISHYKKDKRVNKVYINNGGTIIIDCRN